MVSIRQWIRHAAGTLAAILVIAGIAGCERAHSMAGDKVYEIDVPDIVCEGCAAAIGAALKDIGGVEEVQVDVAEKIVRVGVDSTAISAETVLCDAIKGAGYAPAGAPGDDSEKNGQESGL